jgi:hypothetical protein
LQVEVLDSIVDFGFSAYSGANLGRVMRSECRGDRPTLLIDRGVGRKGEIEKREAALLVIWNSFLSTG